MTNCTRLVNVGLSTRCSARQLQHIEAKNKLKIEKAGENTTERVYVEVVREKTLS